MRKFFATLALVFALCSSTFAADTSGSKSKSKVPMSASVKYFHRCDTYLKPVTLTPEEQAAISKLEEQSAAEIDSDDAGVSKAAKAKLHAAIIVSLTDEQQAALKSAHARKSSKTADKSKSSKSTPEGSDEARD